MTAKVAIFALAAFFEIAGCFSFWMWLRRGATPLVALVPTVNLISPPLVAIQPTVELETRHRHSWFEPNG
jgi:drug/metabolite transporter superfamily protein YnfA